MTSRIQYMPQIDELMSKNKTETTSHYHKDSE